nr:hypothetical protein Iba_chr02bCG24680 [Ipomoea batatas]
MRGLQQVLSSCLEGRYDTTIDSGNFFCCFFANNFRNISWLWSSYVLKFDTRFLLNFRDVGLFRIIEHYSNTTIPCPSCPSRSMNIIFYVTWRFTLEKHYE